MKRFSFTKGIFFITLFAALFLAATSVTIVQYSITGLKMETLARRMETTDSLEQASRDAEENLALVLQGIDSETELSRWHTATDRFRYLYRSLSEEIPPESPLPVEVNRWTNRIRWFGDRLEKKTLSTDEKRELLTEWSTFKGFSRWRFRPALSVYRNQLAGDINRLKRHQIVHFGILMAAALLTMGAMIISVIIIYRRNRNEAEMHILKLNALMGKVQTKNDELHREMENHKETSRELLQYKEHLQGLVDQQTRDLIKANASLRKSMKNLKSTQNQLLISEKLASLGSLVAGVAHEINTPLGSAVTGISWIHDRTLEIRRLYDKQDLSAEEFQEFLSSTDEICRSVSLSLSSAVRLVLSFKQVSVDQTSNEKRAFHVREYLEEIVLSLRNILKKTEIEVQVECDPSLRIESHPGFISQIITNLIQNSLNHGYPDVKKGIILITAKRDHDKLILQYRDDGIGIPAEIRNRIFDPFFTTARGKGGTGLGLHIVYTLVTDNLGGAICLSNTDQPGACFEIRIPVLVLS